MYEKNEIPEAAIKPSMKLFMSFLMFNLSGFFKVTIRYQIISNSLFPELGRKPSELECRREL